MKPSIWTATGILMLAIAGGALPVLAQEEPKNEARAPKTEGVKVTAGSEGFVLQSEGRDFKLQLKGLVQFDGRFYPSDTNNVLTDTFLMRRVRPVLQGTVSRYFDFNLTPDFGGGTTVVLDAFLNVKASPAFNVKIGKFKPPIGIEHLQSDPYLSFVERAFPAGLQPNRDVGVQIHGELGKGTIAYAAGVFNGTPDGASVDLDTNDSKALVGRLVLSPFKAGSSALKNLGLGIAGSTEKQSGSAASVAGYKTGGQSSFFSYAAGAVPSGTRTRMAPELSFFSGPVGIMAEYVESRGRLLKTATTTTSGPFTFGNKAWQATATVFLTGDVAAFDGVTVRKPFDPARGQWGALQLAVRVSGFEADGGAFDSGFADISKSARKASVWGVGLSWYLNRNLKQAASFERTRFTGGAASGANRPAENALLIRSQLSF